ncbi:gamma-glutamyl-gamma-aminobutyrate hydrolase family protein [Arthrobacter sp. ISL-28]|uniref:gamma-glutamyl-gamma-aminobutyrate hydrolase family protein n=1 Tax=Arthrobacter sp. ISL-28 TaxID=2819108 RepID=UPI001BE99470|nr:gamma-glutamyl-gamma-aminobutyrate hydrolase family protein [Arthrobacter sp. ISL-28]MBT2523021.1 gamma-glutamyl-gamma-aminobutyrate hydrolase family protein [Arthrobacter sp. ISL-28]
MSKRPTIALTLGRDLPDNPNDYRIAEAYNSALLDAGAVPVAIAPGLDHTAVQSVLDMVDGLLLPGGIDPHPRLFGETPHPTTNIDEELDELEIMVIAEAMRRRMPILGICRGSQILNVALGGSLIQHLEPGPIQHKQEAQLDITTHDLNLDPESRLGRLHPQTKLRINSLHHQAIGRVGPPLRVVGRSEDGVIEAIESIDASHWIVGVQYHPEWLRADGHDPLFEEFVARAQTHESVPAGGNNCFARPAD